MEIFVNGEKRSCSEKQTLEAFLADEKYDKAKIAVELNGEIIPKAAYAECILGPADKLEVVTFVGGG